MIPEERVLLENLGRIAYTLDKAYISRLEDDYHVLPSDTDHSANDDVCYVSNIRALKINRWVFDQSERPSDCLKNVLSLFADGDHALALVVIRKHDTTDMYFVVKNQGPGRNVDSRNNIDLLDDSIHGNFPGTSTTIMRDLEELELLFSFRDSSSVAVLSNTPSEYSSDYVTQGLEKLLNGIVPNTSESYSVVFLADSLATEEIREVVSGYEEIATAMHPFIGYQFQAGENRSEMQGEMQSIADTKSVSESVSKTHSVNAGVSLSIVKDVAGVHAGYGYSWGQSRASTSGKTEITGTNSSVSVGSSDTTSYSYKSYMVADLVDKTVKTIQRLTRSQSTGLWKFATYVFSNDPKTSKNVANYIRAISQGKDSYIEPSAIQEWHEAEGNDSSDFEKIKGYVTHFTHPVFHTISTLDDDGMLVTPTSYVGTEEVSNVIVFPKTSVPGIPVYDCVSFGRNVVSYDDLDSAGGSIALGQVFHMHQEEPTEVVLDLQSLAGHTFITGSTGAGKTNTVCRILDEAVKSGVHFLVIEPAKGEYKDILGGREGVSVFGTNNAVAPLLRINPFAFSDPIHVLEHLDRLVEVFNVCWPMYAAMPSILKAAIERSYEDCGWDLISSTNAFGAGLFPCFLDVARNVRAILDESEYDAENKGAYKGSLLTRLQSLTNGINGLIFGPNEIESDILFESDVIVDLSRIGSMETKSLIMGMLVLKLQEHRMANSVGSNLPIRHLTVLEEAHNLLKRTSTEQPVEGGNLMGKSVEMLSNAIAEMRTYGEGFIVADQAPGLLDLSAIRNTNTKVIMRLPDHADRELVGRAANLNEKQIGEVARLPMGVAAIYQNNWVQPVLCKIERAGGKEPFEYSPEHCENQPPNPDDSLMIAEILSKGMGVTGIGRLDELQAAMSRANLQSFIRVEILRILEEPPSEPRMTKLGPIMSALFPSVKDAVIRSRRTSAYDPKEWTKSASASLSVAIQQDLEDQVRRDIVQAIITDHILNELRDVRALRDWSERGGLR